MPYVRPLCRLDLDQAHESLAQVHLRRPERHEFQEGRAGRDRSGAAQAVKSGVIANRNRLTDLFILPDTAGGGVAALPTLRRLHRGRRAEAVQLEGQPHVGSGRAARYVDGWTLHGSGSVHHSRGTPGAPELRLRDCGDRVSSQLQASCGHAGHARPRRGGGRHCPLGDGERAWLADRWHPTRGRDSVYAARHLADEQTPARSLPEGRLGKPRSSSPDGDASMLSARA